MAAYAHTIVRFKDGLVLAIEQREESIRVRN
jgi:hypothetical protein